MSVGDWLIRSFPVYGSDLNHWPPTIWVVCSLNPSCIVNFPISFNPIDSFTPFSFFSWRGSDGIPIRSTLSPEDTDNYAALVSQLAIKAAGVVRTLDDNDELAFLRIRYALTFQVLLIISLRYQYVRVHISIHHLFISFVSSLYHLTWYVYCLISSCYFDRSKKHEIMVAPDKDYVLVVIQNPNDV